MGYRLYYRLQLKDEVCYDVMVQPELRNYRSKTKTALIHAEHCNHSSLLPPNISPQSSFVSPHLLVPRLSAVSY